MQIQHWRNGHGATTTLWTGIKSEFWSSNPASTIGLHWSQSTLCHTLNRNSGTLSPVYNSLFFLLDTTSVPYILPDLTIPVPLSLFITCHSHPHLVPYSMHCSLYKASHPLFCTATDEDNRMVVETFGNYQSVLASEVW